MHLKLFGARCRFAFEKLKTQTKYSGQNDFCMCDAKLHSQCAPGRLIYVNRAQIHMKNGRLSQ